MFAWALRKTSSPHSTCSWASLQRQKTVESSMEAGGGQRLFLLCTSVPPKNDQTAAHTQQLFRELMKHTRMEFVARKLVGVTSVRCSHYKPIRGEPTKTNVDVWSGSMTLSHWRPLLPGLNKSRAKVKPADSHPNCVKYFFPCWDEKSKISKMSWNAVLNPDQLRLHADGHFQPV